MSNQPETRTESDSLGELKVPANALWGAQTQRAVENFPLSQQPLPAAFIQAMGLIKSAAAKVNSELGLLDSQRAEAICTAADAIANGEYDDQFPVDVFQTGSGTSSNMNANEVIARLASESSGVEVHPNNHVNLGQSSNDVIPTAIHLAAAIALNDQLLPGLQQLETALADKANSFASTVKTGRTHLMDAMPITFAQEMSGWQQQISHAQQRLIAVQPRLHKLAQGGSAVGTGINVHPEFSTKVAQALSARCNLPLQPSDNFFESLSCQDTAVELSGALKTLACSVMKIANDLRWSSSGPLAGLNETQLKALQPGSSIMPGKVNPVIPEAVCMVAAQVIGNDAAITIGGQAGNFQLNVMLPMIARNLLESLKLLSNICTPLAAVIESLTANTDHIEQTVAKNPVLVTALNSRIGYDLGAKIAKQAYAENRPVIDVASELTDLSDKELEELLEPLKLTRGGIL